MRLGSLTVSISLSAALLSGCSFIGGQPPGYKNPFAKQKSAHQGHYSQRVAGQHCQIASSRQPIPRGCRPEQVTIGTAPQGPYGQQQPNFAGHGGFPQQPQFGQPQYTNGGYGSAVRQTPAMVHHTTRPKKRKPKLRGSLSLGVEKSNAGSLLDYGQRDGDDVSPLTFYDPQVFESGRTGPGANGGTETARYTANEQFADDIYNPFTYESDTRPTISFDDAWSTPASLKAGLEYIVSQNTTVFANGGYTYAEGNEGSTATVTATLYKDFTEVDDDGNVLAAGIAYIPNTEIANFSFNFSDLEQYDVEVGARHYLNPVVKSEGYRTVTPFIGASVGVSHVNATDITFGQQQAAYDTTFENISTGENNGETEWFEVPADNPGANPLLGTTARLYDAQWLPQGQLNIGAEWQITPGFAIAAETGLKFKGAREYADFTDTNGDSITGRKGDVNISVPLTLRGSVNF